MCPQHARFSSSSSKHTQENSELHDSLPEHRKTKRSEADRQPMWRDVPRKQQAPATASATVQSRAQGACSRLWLQAPAFNQHGPVTPKEEYIYHKRVNTREVVASPYSGGFIWASLSGFQILQAERTRGLASQSQCLPLYDSKSGNHTQQALLRLVETWTWRMGLKIVPREQGIAPHCFGQRAPGQSSADPINSQDSQHTTPW